jgi:hypothetical protein
MGVACVRQVKGIRDEMDDGSAVQQCKGKQKCSSLAVQRQAVVQQCKAGAVDGHQCANFHYLKITEQGTFPPTAIVLQHCPMALQIQEG